MISNHWLQEAKKVLSPNFNERPDRSQIDLLVIHCISLPPGQYGGSCISNFFTNRLNMNAHPYFKQIAELKVSAHLLIERSGQVIQFVGFDKRAWHAGESCFMGDAGCNDFSIGIELEGAEDESFETCQYQKLAEVSVALMHAYPAITRERIAGHSDIAGARKTDPGRCFDWEFYRRLLDQYPKRVPES